MTNSDAVTCYLGLGSNLGDRERNLELAVSYLKERMKIETVSSIYDTAPVGDENQPRFLNMAVKASARLTAPAILFIAKGIESKLGRVPVGSPRPIDIDILFYGGEVINTPPDLVVPHPRIHERAFVLIPLAEIAPDMVHPVLNESVKQMLEKVDGQDGVLPWTAPTGKSYV
jgi:2-amino-4-hydroxy-6-hydroxymethyldihydropteridine diphosphokinase